MKKALVVGGARGLGLSISHELANQNYSEIIILDKTEISEPNTKFKFIKTNLQNKELDIMEHLIDEIDTIVITAGIGRLIDFRNTLNEEIDITFNVNTIMPIKIINLFSRKLYSNQNLNIVILSSIAGIVSSPLYSLYSATKASLVKLIEAINIELSMEGYNNRILNVSPGRIDGTNFNNNKTELNVLEELSREIINRMNNKEENYIPNYSNIYSSVINNYQKNPVKFGIDSYKYKSIRGLEPKIKYKVGYLSGTFDLFHVGHLNLIRKAKDYCDYLVVGVHKDGSHKNIITKINYDDRVEILKSIKYVDMVIESEKEDSDVYFNKVKYDYLFVGSDYKGTVRFDNYEKILRPFGVEIIYFPYTRGISSSKLRGELDE